MEGKSKEGGGESFPLHKTLYNNNNNTNNTNNNTNYYNYHPNHYHQQQHQQQQQQYPTEHFYSSPLPPPSQHQQRQQQPQQQQQHYPRYNNYQSYQDYNYGDDYNKTTSLSHYNSSSENNNTSATKYNIIKKNNNHQYHNNNNNNNNTINQSTDDNCSPLPFPQFSSSHHYPISSSASVASTSTSTISTSTAATSISRPSPLSSILPLSPRDTLSFDELQPKSSKHSSLSLLQLFQDRSRPLPPYSPPEYDQHYRHHRSPTPPAQQQKFAGNTIPEYPVPCKPQRNGIPNSPLLSPQVHALANDTDIFDNKLNYVSASEYPKLANQKGCNENFDYYTYKNHQTQQQPRSDQFTYRQPSSYFPTPVTTPTPPPSQIDTTEGGPFRYPSNHTKTSSETQAKYDFVNSLRRSHYNSSGYSHYLPNDQPNTIHQSSQLPFSLSSPIYSFPDRPYPVQEPIDLITPIARHLIYPRRASVAGAIVSSGPHSTRGFAGVRKRGSLPGFGYRRLSSIMAGADGTATMEATARPKRVRTGCLTCRQRHLKCDEAMPECQNCRKSSRVCKRGVRLNFIDTQVKKPPILHVGHPWKIEFQDESREIASEYAGGSQRYAAFQVPSPKDKRIAASASPKRKQSSSGAPQPLLPEPLPPIEPHIPTAGTAMNHSLSKRSDGMSDDGQKSGSRLHVMHPPSGGSGAGGSAIASDNASHSAADARSLLNKPEESLFMQVYVEEVGCWMDSMNSQKHFSRLLPFHALGEPMLLHAFLACGARHLTLVNPGYKEDRALYYYDTATRLLLDSLTNPNRNTAVCATTSVILNVYEIMSERPLQRMNHIAGARALIKECGWSAKTKGIGGACFWINVTMELLSCLHFNWTIAWDPDDWGVDMDFSQGCDPGQEEIWTHRIIYLLAKIANFRASVPRYQEASTAEEQNQMNSKLAERYEEWRRLKEHCDAWNNSIPRNMHPMSYLYSYQTSAKSAFPEVWIIKRVVIIARLFYHTAMVLLAQINPVMSRDISEMNDMAAVHAQQICGIVAPLKDRGVASVALRSLAIAAECLTARNEQEEVLQILSRIKKETGWRVDFLFKELKETWGWQPDPSQPPESTQPPPTSLLTTTLLNHAPSTIAPPPGFTPSASQFQPLQNPTGAIPVQRPRRYPILNPLQAATALEFTTQAPHPYYPHYVSAPQQTSERHIYL